MKVFLTIVIVLVCLLVGGGVFVWSGVYNVAAVAPHWNVTLWVLEETRESSIAAHSKGILLPDLNKAGLAQKGFKDYHETCELCHGAPGIKPKEFAQGLNPHPPDLSSRDSQELKNAELFWIVKNGIKMTGMPAFGPTYSEDQLYEVVAFLRLLPKLTPEEYSSMATKAAATDGTRGP
jgi:mono/diheme cytochrome c family protein